MSIEDNVLSFSEFEKQYRSRNVIKTDSDVFIAYQEYLKNSSAVELEEARQQNEDRIRNLENQLKEEESKHDDKLQKYMVAVIILALFSVCAILLLFLSSSNHTKEVNVVRARTEREAYDSGYEIGFEEGRKYESDEIYNNVCESMYEEGHYDGYREGYNEGSNDGYNHGYDEGYYEGYNEGYGDCSVELAP